MVGTYLHFGTSLGEASGQIERLQLWGESQPRLQIGETSSHGTDPRRSGVQHLSWANAGQ